MTAIELLEVFVNAINNEDCPAFREPVLTPEELGLLQTAEDLIAKHKTKMHANSREFLAYCNGHGWMVQRPFISTSGRI